MITHMETPTTRDEWAPLLDQLNQKRAAATAMGGEERVAKHRSAGKLDARQRLDHSSIRNVRRARCVGREHARGRRAGCSGRRLLVGGIGEIDGRSAVAAAEDFTVLGIHRHGRIGQALPPGPTRRPGACAACLHARGRRASRCQRPSRASSQRPPGAGRTIGIGSDGMCGPRSIGWAWSAYRSAVRFRGDDAFGVAVHSRPTAGQGGLGRRRDERGVGWSEHPRRTVRRCAQPRARRRSGNRSRPSVFVLLPAERVDGPAGSRDWRRRSPGPRRDP